MYPPTTTDKWPCNDAGWGDFTATTHINLMHQQFIMVALQ